MKRYWGKLYDSQSMGKKPFTGKRKDYISVSGDKATSDSHGVAVQRYTSEGQKKALPLKKWKDNEDPFTISTTTIDEDDDEEEIPVEVEDDDEDENVPESHYEVTASTGTSDIVEIQHTHPNYEEIFDLLRKGGE